MTRMAMSEARCSFCHTPEGQHGDRQHRFTLTGRLEPIAAPPGASRGGLSGIDIPLRFLLLEKGLIKAEDLLKVEAELHEHLANPPQRPNPSRDGADRPASGS